MRLVLTDSFDPYYNLACEEALLRNSTEDVFMLWQNAPTVVIGRNQNVYAEVDLAYTEAHGINVVRRITGGGAVYHDLGNVNFSFMTSRDKAEVLDFEFFTRPIVKALRTLSIDAFLSGRNDLLVRTESRTESGETETAELKFSGNAMTATDTRILLHGTLLFDSDLSVLEKTLRPDEEKLRKRAIKSVRSRVTNLRPLLREDMTTDGFFRYLVSFIEREFTCRAEIAEKASVEATGLPARNRTNDWISGRRGTYDAERRCRFDSGLVVLAYRIREERMADVRIEGDFFGKKDVTELAEKLNGVKCGRAAAQEALAGIDVSEYIQGVDTDDFVTQLF